MTAQTKTGLVANADIEVVFGDTKEEAGLEADKLCLVHKYTKLSGPHQRPDGKWYQGVRKV